MQRLAVFSRWQTVQYALLVTAFIATNLLFWGWWLQPEHRGNPILYSLMVVCFFYQATILPGVYAFYLGWMRKPKHIDAPPGLRVAIISLTVPGSESMDVVRQQLEAMAEVTYPHESWILVDKVHSPEVEAMAIALGVRYFSRHDRARWGDLVEYWNQPEAPFKEKTKAGNVNAWLDAMLRLDIAYDYFVQLDIDHIPVPEYLDKVLGFFADQKVAWVQAPSVYGDFTFWTARGSSEQELVLQGPLQSGFFGFCRTPFIIGSHSTYRTAAVREIGGFQPTRAEDHLDTVVLASRGYEGVFLSEVIATGQGPDSFETYLGQQFAWAYSMITVMLRYTPRLVWRYTPRQALQFLFVQTWYALWSTTTLIMFLLPGFALVFNTSISHVPFLEFLAFSLPPAFVALLIWWWSRKWFQPQGMLLSWRGIALQIARWPVVLSAFVQVLLRREKPYMITPKGVKNPEDRTISLMPYLPFMLLAGALLAASWYFLLFIGRGEAQGYLLFTLLGMLAIVRVMVVAVGEDQRRLHARHVRVARIILTRGRTLGVLAAWLLAILITGIASFHPIIEAVTYYQRHGTEANIAVGTGTPAISASSATPSRVAGPIQSTPTASPVASPAATSSPVATPAPSPLPTPALPVVSLASDHLLLGVYDPAGAFNDVPLDIEHAYISWERADLIGPTVGAIRQRSRVPLLTIEPWTTASGDPANVLADTAAGKNDDVIRQDAAAIRAQAPQQVIVRFAHEMDLIGNYPWSIADSDLYIRAYRHYVDLFRSVGVQNVLWVWSPAGNTNAPAYYPGDAYTDWVGVTVLEYKEWDIRAGATDGLSFDALFGPKYDVVSPFGKPVLIAELGVSGDAAYQTSWLQGAFQSASGYALLHGMVYFNAVNAPNNVTGDQPDFRIAHPLPPPTSSPPAPP